jgi:hypothetical protein
LPSATCQEARKRPPEFSTIATKHKQSPYFFKEIRAFYRIDTLSKHYLPKTDLKIAKMPEYSANMGTFGIYGQNVYGEKHLAEELINEILQGYPR